MFLIDAEVWRAMSPKRVPRCDVDHGAADRFERTLLLASLSVAVEGRCDQRQLEHTWNSQYCMRLWRVCR
jgi:hypothetical protein